MNVTIEKFGYPESLIHEYENWVVLLRPKQVTLGCMVLACRGSATSFGTVTPQAYAELTQVCADMELALNSAFQAEKLNMLALMMVDPHVHFHVIPRYSSPREFAGLTFSDPAWPKPPDLAHAASITLQEQRQIQQELITHWPRS